MNNQLFSLSVFLACSQFGDKNILECLLKTNIDVNSTNNKNLTALMIACICGKKVFVETLLKNYPECISFKNEKNQTVLHIGILKNRFIWVIH